MPQGRVTPAKAVPWLAQAGLPFLLITYLGLRGGGYDAIVRSEIGVAAWWIVLLGVTVGALPMARLNRGAWIALGLLGALALWTALGISWSESSERSMAELGRVLTLLGVFALALSVQGREGLRRMLGGVAAAIGLVCGIALLSRFEPTWFPELDAPTYLPDESLARLHYPLNYWNGLAAFTAMGIPLLLVLATSARQLAVRTLALAAFPVLALTAFFTLSRGGAIAIAVALAVLFALHSRRLAVAARAAVAGGGSLILIAAANQRDALADGLTDTVATSQGDEMLVITLVVVAAVAVLGFLVARADRDGIGPRLHIGAPGRKAVLAGVATVIAALAIALVAGGAGKLADAWDDFKDPSVPAAAADRFDSTGGSGRYQFWETALDANATDPLVGIGPGTYEFFWAREGSLPTSLRDAHSLYLETLAELGIVGLILVLAVVAVPFALGARRLLARGPRERDLLAGALAGCAAFATAAGIDWAWELTVLPVAFLLLAAAVIAHPGAETAPAWSPRGRLLPVGVAIASIAVIAVPMTSVDAIRDSQAAVRASDLSSALDEARTAADIEPFAATPRIQEALVLELQGDIDGAVAAARTATENEPTNWQTWLVLSRLEAVAGDTEASVEAYREARDLNPRSILFQE